MLVRTQILFPKEDLLELQELAKARDISVSQLVRTEIKKKVLRKSSRKKSVAQAMLELAKWAEEHHTTGPSDLSTNDDYLYGKLSVDYYKHFPKRKR